MRLPVPARLAPFVRGMHLVPSGGARERYARVADGEPELLVRFTTDRTMATLVGPRTTPLVKHSELSAHTLLVRFHVGGAYPFFGRSMAGLADRVVALSELWGPARCADLDRTHDGASMVAATVTALERALHADTLFEPRAARRALRTAAALAVGPRPPTVDELARHLGTSTRQLRRVWNDVVGMPPKRFARIVRFRRVLAVARNVRAPRWSAVAHELGYFDQAHLISEFRAMSGTTPGTFQRRL